MTPQEAILKLNDLQKQIIHGSTVFGDIAKVILTMAEDHTKAQTALRERTREAIGEEFASDVYRLEAERDALKVELSELRASRKHWIDERDKVERELTLERDMARGGCAARRKDNDELREEVAALKAELSQIKELRSENLKLADSLTAARYGRDTYEAAEIKQREAYWRMLARAEEAEELLEQGSRIMLLDDKKRWLSDVADHLALVGRAAGAGVGRTAPPAEKETTKLCHGCPTARPRRSRKARNYE